MKRKSINESRNSFICTKCGKHPVTANNKSHSERKTKKTIKPNLQLVAKKLMCTKCIKKNI